MVHEPLCDPSFSSMPNPVVTCKLHSKTSSPSCRTLHSATRRRSKAHYDHTCGARVLMKIWLSTLWICVKPASTSSWHALADLAVLQPINSFASRSNWAFICRNRQHNTRVDKVANEDWMVVSITRSPNRNPGGGRHEHNGLHAHNYRRERRVRRNHTAAVQAVRFDRGPQDSCHVAAQTGGYGQTSGSNKHGQQP